MISFIGNFKNRHLNRDNKNEGFLRTWAGAWRGKEAAKGYRVSFGDDENVLKLMVANLSEYTTKTLDWTFKCVNCMVSQLYHHKTVTKIIKEFR